MKKILITDGDVIARRAIAKILQEQTEHQLIVNGDITTAIDSIIGTEPDLLVLGVRAEEVEESAILSTIFMRFPDLPIIIVTERSEPGAALAIAALRMGAIDFITKPDDCNSMLFAEQHLEKRLLPVIDSALNIKPTRGSSSRYPYLSSKIGTLKSVWRLNLVVIGGCTGGPVALFELLQSLPDGFDVPIIIVQHMPKYFTKVLASRLNEVSEFDVQEADDGAELKPGTVWIAPGGYHTEVFRNSNKTLLKVHRGPREHGMRPSVDKLFRSAAGLYGPGVLGVIMSGSGLDGVAGASSVKRAGGNVIVQDYRTALVPDLPLSVIAAGYHDLVSPVEYMAELFLLREESVKPMAAEAKRSSSLRENKEMPTRTRFRKVNRLLFNPIS